jgi:hypothetical protein
VQEASDDETSASRLVPALAAILVGELSLHLVQLAGIRPWAIAVDWHVFQGSAGLRALR